MLQLNAKIIKTGTLFALLMASLMACTPKSEAEKMSYPELLDRLKMESAKIEAAQPNQIDTAMVNRFGEEVKVFAKRFNKDTLGSIFFWKAIVAEQKIGQFNQAIGLLDAFVIQFPKSKKVAEAIFLKAFITETGLNNKDQAANIYQSFINAFPTDPLAQDAKLLLEQIQKKVSDDELIRQFEEKEKEAGSK